MSVTSVEAVRVAICPYACEVFVYHGLLCRDTASRVVHEECVQQVKTNVVEVLRAELASPKWTGEPVAMGTATDPYQHCEVSRWGEDWQSHEDLYMALES